MVQCTAAASLYSLHVTIRNTPSITTVRHPRERVFDIPQPPPPPVHTTSATSPDPTPTSEGAKAETLSRSQDGRGGASRKLPSRSSSQCTKALTAILGRPPTARALWLLGRGGTSSSIYTAFPVVSGCFTFSKWVSKLEALNPPQWVPRAALFLRTHGQCLESNF